MFCLNCGKKISEKDGFCTGCGEKIQNATTTIKQRGQEDLEHKTWYRFLKVIYVVLYLPLPFLLWLVYENTGKEWVYSTGRLYSGYYVHHPEEAIIPILITLLVYLIIARLVKIAFLYIFTGSKPQWKREFKRLF